LPSLWAAGVEQAKSRKEALGIICAFKGGKGEKFDIERKASNDLFVALTNQFLNIHPDSPMDSICST
jgi:hypothetical protein